MTETMVVTRQAAERADRSEPRTSSASGTLGLGTTARVVQGVTHQFRKFASAMPALIAVRAGSKTLRCDRTSLEVNAGDMVVIPAHLAVDVENHVAPSGPYVAEMLAFNPAFLEAQAMAHPSATARQPLRQPVLLANAPEGLAGAFRVAADALAGSDSALPTSVVAHRLAEPLVWLGDLLDGVLLAPQTTMTAQVRSTLSADPARAWSADAMARRIGASAPTLRRKLAAESTGFAEILNDVRMSTALTLIQTTTAPISDIAAAVGYDSPSRFAVRFRRRFGVAPTVLRGHQRD